ncbi:MAG TPA: hypothetical protein VFI98_06480 [Pseudolabrys sp.]|nr:hypothetical protein [Pseudolabrys sp.]
MLTLQGAQLRKHHWLACWKTAFAICAVPCYLILRVFFELLYLVHPAGNFLGGFRTHRRGAYFAENKFVRVIGIHSFAGLKINLDFACVKERLAQQSRPAVDVWINRERG